MKKQIVDSLISDLTSIKNITDKQEYLVSSKVNTIYTKMLPELEKESKRLSDSDVEITSPKILILEYNKFDSSSQNMCETFSKQINKELQNLVINNYKIIDYGLINKEVAYIKYTD